MTKYIARVTHETYGTHYARDMGSGSWWTEDIDKAKRFDTHQEALDASATVADDYTKQALVAPEDRIYAAGRSRRNGNLYYRAKAAGWYLTSFADTAHEFSTRFWASQSFAGMNKNFWDFKVGTMDEIQKWYDQFGKSDPVTIDDVVDKVEGFKPGGVIPGPLASFLANPQGIIFHHAAEPANQPEIVKIRRSVESAVSSELSWDAEKMGVIIDFLGSDFLEEGMTVDKLYSVLYDLHEEMTEDDE